MAELATRAGARRRGSEPAGAAAAAARRAQAGPGGGLEAYQSFAGEALGRAGEIADAALAAGYDGGPLHGLTVSVKDLFGVASLPTYAGSPRELPAQWQREGPVVAALKQQLALLTGKTRTVEFAYGGLGPNAHWPCPRNPWDAVQARVPGGSSAGAAVSLWDGTADLAVGTDTAGSVRVPASLCGLAGLKLTRGRWSTEGVVPLCPSFDSIGLLAHSAADLAYAFAALDGPVRGRGGPVAPPPAAELAGLRLGVAETLVWDELSPGVGEAVESALAELARHGAAKRRCDLPEAREAFDLFRQGGGLTPPELYAFLQAELPEWVATLDPRVAERIEAGYAVPAWQYRYRRTRFAELGGQAAARLGDVDVVATPTVALTPPRMDDVAAPEAYGPANIQALRNTCIGNCLDLCGVSLPVGRDDAGMPVGLQLLAAPGRERSLLAVARAVEQALGPREVRLGRPPLAVA